jgi:hypothetical protein
MTEANEFLRELLDVMNEQLRWQRAAVMPSVRATLDDTLTTTRMRQAYELCDGTNSATSVAKDINVSKAAISRWTKRWRELGIAYETRDRCIRHLVSLNAVGLPVEVDAAESASKNQHRH